MWQAYGTWCNQFPKGSLTVAQGELTVQAIVLGSPVGPVGPELVFEMLVIKYCHRVGSIWPERAIGCGTAHCLGAR